MNPLPLSKDGVLLYVMRATGCRLDSILPANNSTRISANTTTTMTRASTSTKTKIHEGEREEIIEKEKGIGEWENGGEGEEWNEEAKAHVSADANDSNNELQMFASFESMGLNGFMVDGINSHGFERPSLIQQKAIVPISNGRDAVMQVSFISSHLISFYFLISSHLIFHLISEPVGHGQDGDFSHFYNEQDRSFVHANATSDDSQPYKRVGRAD